MSHLKRVSRVAGETRVLLCSKHCWESEVETDVKLRVAEIANGKQNQKPDQETELNNLACKIVDVPATPVYIKEMQLLYKDIWPLDFSKCSQPAGFKILIESCYNDIPDSLLINCLLSKARHCSESQFCYLLKSDSHEVIGQVDGPAKGCIIDHPVMLLAEQTGAQAKERDQGKGDDQYYFKELVLLTDVEPCFMCAMALIHCRV